MKGSGLVAYMNLRRDEPELHAWPPAAAFQDLGPLPPASCNSWRISSMHAAGFQVAVGGSPLMPRLAGAGPAACTSAHWQLAVRRRARPRAVPASPADTTAGPHQPRSRIKYWGRAARLNWDI
jgi:hypothetical protein